MAKKTHKLPDTIYVYTEVADNEPYLVACYEMRDAADPETKQLVGTYKLSHLSTVEMKVVATPK